VKSRGFYAGVQIDGTVITERKDANAVFYGSKVPVEAILHGSVPAGSWQPHVNRLIAVVRGAQGNMPTTHNQAGPSQAGPAGQYGYPPGAGAHAIPYGGPAGQGSYPGQQSASGVASATQGMQQMHLGSSQPSQPGMSKAQEAAAESAANHPTEPPPPGYDDHEYQPASDELPPAYVGDGQTHPGTGDSKSEYH
jgi:hypothetical protein